MWRPLNRRAAIAAGTRTAGATLAGMREVMGAATVGINTWLAQSEALQSAESQLLETVELCAAPARAFNCRVNDFLESPIRRPTLSQLRLRLHHDSGRWKRIDFLPPAPLR